MRIKRLIAGSILTLVVLSSVAAFQPGLFYLPGPTGVARAGVLPTVISAPAPVQPSGSNTPAVTSLPAILVSRQAAAQVASPPAKEAAVAPASAPTAPKPAPSAPAPAAPKPGAPKPAPSAPKPTTPSPSTGTSGGIAGHMNYTVKAGDDLAALAEKFGTTAAAIAKASWLPEGQTLYPGMLLRIPTKDKSKVQEWPKAVAIPWSEVDKMWAIGTVAQVMDVETGNIFFVMRRGGWAHADSEPVTAKDTATILSDYGGSWSWARRSIVVTINGQRIAASQNFYPHGQKSIANNNMPGHFCIHFLGSTTHGSSYTSNGVPTLDPAHQRCVQAAVGH